MKDQCGNKPSTNIIHHQDCLVGMKSYPDNFFDCCVTSPPYFRLRDYQVQGQLGQEKEPYEYVHNLMAIFAEVTRVLSDRGTIWLNLGDSYASSGGYGGTGHLAGYGKIKEKDLIGIPWLVALALRDSGLYLRQDIIWKKPNPMPEGVHDRCTKSHEYIFLFSKSPNYYYDQYALSHALKTTSVTRMGNAVSGSHKYSNGIPGFQRQRINAPRKQRNQRIILTTDTRANKRSVWTIAAKGYKGAHFATYPEEIPYLCIRAGCPQNGTVLDPFSGAGTTALVARKLQRQYVGFELNEAYVRLSERRLQKDLGLFG